MTFKHIKFEDSPIMRSLEKVALKHDLISSDTINKTASAVEQPDFTISSNLMENVIKLCSGLRKLGFEKHADELAGKFLNYKQATTMYETSKETGDDLIESAHPEGSHALVGVEGDAVVETILDQHLQHVKMVEKKPTGKLASNNDIINAVKKIVAQDAGVISNSLKSLLNSLNLISYAYHKQNVLTRPWTDPENLIRQVEALNNIGNVSSEQASKLKIDINDLRNMYDPGTLGTTGVHRNTWAEMAPYFDRASAAVNNIIKEISNPKISEVAQAPSNYMQDFSKQISDVADTLRLWSSIVFSDPENTESDKKVALSWINSKLSQVNGIKDALEKSQNSPQLIPLLNINLNKIKTFKPDPKTLNFAEFEQEWIGK